MAWTLLNRAPAIARARSSTFPLLRDLVPKVILKPSQNLGFGGYVGALGCFFDEKRGSKKRPEKREVKNGVQGVMATIEPTMVGPRVSP